MKKVLSMLLVICMLLAFAGCGDVSNNGGNNSNPPAGSQGDYVQLANEKGELPESYDENELYFGVNLRLTYAWNGMSMKEYHIDPLNAEEYLTDDNGEDIYEKVFALIGDDVVKVSENDEVKACLVSLADSWGTDYAVFCSVPAE